MSSLNRKQRSKDLLYSSHCFTGQAPKTKKNAQQSRKHTSVRISRGYQCFGYQSPETWPLCTAMCDLQLLILLPPHPKHRIPGMQYYHLVVETDLRGHTCQGSTLPNKPRHTMYNSTEVCRCSCLTTNTGIIKYILHLSTQCALVSSSISTSIQTCYFTSNTWLKHLLVPHMTDVSTLCLLYSVTISFHRALSCIYSQVWSIFHVFIRRDSNLASKWPES